MARITKAVVEARLAWKQLLQTFLRERFGSAARNADLAMEIEQNARESLDLSQSRIWHWLNIPNRAEVSLKSGDVSELGHRLRVPTETEHAALVWILVAMGVLDAVDSSEATELCELLGFAVPERVLGQAEPCLELGFLSTCNLG